MSIFTVRDSPVWGMADLKRPKVLHKYIYKNFDVKMHLLFKMKSDLKLWLHKLLHFASAGRALKYVQLDHLMYSWVTRLFSQQMKHDIS